MSEDVPGKFGELKIKHLVFDKYGVVMVVDGKTGMRRVRLVFSAPYLASWLDIHPEKHNPDAYLWVGMGQRGRSKQLNYSAMECPRCKHMNGSTSGFCSKCGMALRVDVAVYIEKKQSDIAMALMELVEKEPEIAKILRESV